MNMQSKVVSSDFVGVLTLKNSQKWAFRKKKNAVGECVCKILFLLSSISFPFLVAVLGTEGPPLIRISFGSTNCLILGTYQQLFALIAGTSLSQIIVSTGGQLVAPVNPTPSPQFQLAYSPPSPPQHGVVTAPQAAAPTLPVSPSTPLDPEMVKRMIADAVAQHLDPRSFKRHHSSSQSSSEGRSKPKRQRSRWVIVNDKSNNSSLTENLWCAVLQKKKILSCFSLLVWVMLTHVNFLW
jgi:hypothetical protein